MKPQPSSLTRRQILQLAAGAIATAAAPAIAQAPTDWDPVVPLAAFEAPWERLKPVTMTIVNGGRVTLGDVLTIAGEPSQLYRVVQILTCGTYYGFTAEPVRDREYLRPVSGNPE